MSSLILAQFPADDWPWEKIAREELNDVPELRAPKVAELLAKIQDYQMAHPKFRPQIDEAFLLAFLRGRKYDVEKAFKSYVQFYKIRLCNPKKLYPVGKGPQDFMHILDGPVATALSSRNPIDGSFVIIWSFRHFKLGKHGFEDPFNMTLYAALEAMVDPSFQAYGVRFIFDLTGASFMLIARGLTHMDLIKAVIMMQGAFPARFKGFHFVNDPSCLLKPCFTVVWPLLSAKLKERIHVHGSDIDGLHDFISPEILPEEFGGSAGPMQAHWFRDTLQAVHGEIVKNSYYGFANP